MLNPHAAARIFVLALVVLANQAGAQQPAQGSAAPSRQEAFGSIFLEAWNITRLSFYDPAMNGVDWPAVRDELLPSARAAANQSELSAVINRALARLNASHTAHYTPDQREYYELLDVFWPEGVPERAGSEVKPGPVQYVGIGVVARVIDGRVFAADVFDDGPAAHAGLKVGDELIGVEDGPWSDIAAFREREGKATRLTIRRTEGAEPLTLTVTPVGIRPRAMFLESMKVGARMLEHNERRVAYVRVRSYAHRDYHDLLKRLLSDDFRDADALVLDLRGGWGGARPDYLDIFNPIVPTLESTDREGKAHPYNAAWKKPAAVIIDRYSRSGKEILAYSIRKHSAATLVGERTAGAVLGGTVRPLSDGSLLYIAVQDVKVDGERLEGVGVKPHMFVPFEVRFAGGKDPQPEAALDAVTR